MNDEKFWRLIESAKLAAGDDLDARVAGLRFVLQEQDRATIEAFQATYDRHILQANRWDLWGAAYLMNGGCSDDGFRYFRDWLISEGQQRFNASLEDPDSLVTVEPRDYYELELFGYAALEAYAALGGGELSRDHAGEFGEPEGEVWDEERLPALFPKLAKRFGDR